MSAMRRITVVLALVCALVPATARADEGGFLEFIWGLDPKLIGAGSEIHLFCLKANGDHVPDCEEWWFLKERKPTQIAELKHEVDFRFAYFREYGTTYEGVSNANSINAWKLMGMYKYHPDLHITVGMGAGIMPFYGSSSDGKSFDAFTRAALAPISVTYAPSTSGGKWTQSFYIRGEATFYPTGFSPGDFDNRLPKTETKGEWNFSISTGFDFRRRFLR
jgi:hypothetical protein